MGVVNFGAVILSRALADREHRGRLYAGSPRGRFAVAEFVKADNVAQAFAIRCVTNWIAERPPGAFLNRVQHVRFEKVIVRGSFEWNAIECAGGGTFDVGFGEINVEGKCLTACDFDKGSHINYMAVVQGVPGGFDRLIV
jgi:hypothetical protein